VTPRAVPAHVVPDVYGLFRCGQRRVWARIRTALQTLADAASAIVWDVSVDSTIARSPPACSRQEDHRNTNGWRLCVVDAVAVGMKERTTAAVPTNNSARYANVM
jgi:hypothetical protein